LQQEQNRKELPVISVWKKTNKHHVTLKEVLAGSVTVLLLRACDEAKKRHGAMAAVLVLNKLN